MNYDLIDYVFFEFVHMRWC